jgi:transposase
MGEGSLHPRPEDRGIRDPPHSLCIKRSRVLPKDDRDLRTLTRARSAYTKTRTQLRNRIHKYLALCGITLSSYISDIFGKSGRHILDGLIKSMDIDKILDSILSGKVKKKRDLIKASLGKGLDDVSRMLVKDTLELLDHPDEKMMIQAWRYLVDFRKELKT